MCAESLSQWLTRVHHSICFFYVSSLCYVIIFFYIEYLKRLRDSETHQSFLIENWQNNERLTETHKHSWPGHDQWSLLVNLKVVDKHKYKPNNPESPESPESLGVKLCFVLKCVLSLWVSDSRGFIIPYVFFMYHHCVMLLFFFILNIWKDSETQRLTSHF